MRHHRARDEQFGSGMQRQIEWASCITPTTSSISRWAERSCSASEGSPIARSRIRALLVIIDAGCKFKRPAYYDDLLTLKTSVARVTHVKIVHNYQLFRDGVLLAEGHTTLACVDREGKPQPLPDLLR